MENLDGYFRSGREMPEISVEAIDAVNPWDPEKNIRRYKLIQAIYNVTSIEYGYTTEDLCYLFGMDEHKVKQTIYLTRYRVKWLLANDYKQTGIGLDDIRWVYFRAVKEHDQRRYIRKRYLDYVIRGLHIDQLSAMSDLPLDDVIEIYKDAEKEVEEKLEPIIPEKGEKKKKKEAE